MIKEGSKYCGFCREFDNAENVNEFNVCHFCQNMLKKNNTTLQQFKRPLVESPSPKDPEARRLYYKEYYRKNKEAIKARHKTYYRKKKLRRSKQ